MLFRRSRDDTFFLQGTNSLRAKIHSNLLAVYHKSLLLKVWFKNPFSTSKREANVVAKLFTFTGEFASCCHIKNTFLPLIFLLNLY